jgi:hypothetical protein
MAQPYDLSGLAAAQVTIAQMVADQAAGRTKFAGGFETWVPNPPGTFLAKLSVGGSLTATTTNAVRAMLTSVRMVFDLIAGGTGVVAESAVTSNSAAVPAPALASGAKGAVGPVVYSGAAQATSYDLSGIAALQTTASAMLADQQSGVTNFETAFLAVLTSGGASQSLTMPGVRDRLASLRRTFDQLAQ